MIGLLELLAIGYAIFLAALIVQSAWMLTHPHRKTYAWAVSRARPGDPSELAGGRPFSTWTFTSRGLTFEVWDIPGDKPDGPVVVLAHGWADSRLGGLLRVPFLAPGASRLVLGDLRGHGEAPGVCRLGTAEVEDLLAMIDAVAPAPTAGAGTGGGSSTHLVLYGWSLGAGVCIAAAARSSAVGGVIAEAPYRLAPTPARHVMRGLRLPYRLNLPPAFWILGTLFGVGPRWRGFDRAAHAAGLRCPILVVHGESDGVCPLEDAREIAAAASDGELLVVPGGGHNNLWTEPGSAALCANASSALLARVAAGSGRGTGTLRA